MFNKCLWPDTVAPAFNRVNKKMQNYYYFEQCCARIKAALSLVVLLQYIERLYAGGDPRCEHWGCALPG